MSSEEKLSYRKKLTKTGDSYSVVLNRALLRKLGWVAGQAIVLEEDGDGVRVTAVSEETPASPQR